VKGISDLINTAGLVNVDFADVRSIMGQTGDAIMGAGEGAGESRVTDAVNQAISNVLLEDTSIAGARAILINVTGGEDMSISEWKEIAEMITGQVDADANIIIGLAKDPSLTDSIRVTVIATGFERAKSGAQSHDKQIWKSYEMPEQQAVTLRTHQQFKQKPAGRHAEPVAVQAQARSSAALMDYLSEDPEDFPSAVAEYDESAAQESQVSFELPGAGRRAVAPGAPERAERVSRPERPGRSERQARPEKPMKYNMDDYEIPAYLRRKKS
jgi:hypothetical protein